MNPSKSAKRPTTHVARPRLVERHAPPANWPTIRRPTRALHHPRRHTSTTWHIGALLDAAKCTLNPRTSHLLYTATQARGLCRTRCPRQADQGHSQALAASPFAGTARSRDIAARLWIWWQSSAHPRPSRHLPKPSKSRTTLWTGKCYAAHAGTPSRSALRRNGRASPHHAAVHCRTTKGNSHFRICITTSTLRCSAVRETRMRS